MCSNCDVAFLHFFWTIFYHLGKTDCKAVSPISVISIKAVWYAAFLIPNYSLTRSLGLSSLLPPILNFLVLLDISQPYSWEVCFPAYL